MLYRAHPGSGLRRLIGDDGEPPYWAYHWAGGTVLARHILDHPETVLGKRIVDLGSGSGVVAIAAMKSGAKAVMAVDIDPNAVAVIPLNADANSVRVTAIEGGLDASMDADLILVGDLFYDEALAEKVAAFLTDRLAAGVESLVGDMGRRPLPLDLLEPLAEYDVPDFGQVPLLRARVFRFVGARAG